MRNFKVLVIAHCLKQNKVAKWGEVVSESQLTSPADELVSAGFIEEVFESKEVVDKQEQIIADEIEVKSEEVVKEVLPKKAKK
ncbi:MAG: hypothetical protein RL528_950 [Bacteroidota bacterium]|jgi:hypothetical protein